MGEGQGCIKGEQSIFTSYLLPPLPVRLLASLPFVAGSPLKAMPRASAISGCDFRIDKYLPF